MASVYALAQSETNDAVARAIAALPPCYGFALDNCLNEGNAAGRMSAAQCNAINAGYDADWEALETAVDALPYCPQPPRSKRATMFAVGAGGLAAGVLAAALTRRR